ncbi:MAG: serine/threonine-protein kinase [Planctomycetota bacterium]
MNDTTKPLDDGEDPRLEGLAPVMNLLNQARELADPPTARKKHLEIEPPNKLGDFELLYPIGRGGMGVVYEARQRSLDRIVAIKVLPKSVLPESLLETTVEPTSQQNLIQRFHVEARAAARLHHSNIVPVFGFGEAEGFYYFVMQRIHGATLARWIDDRFGEGDLSETDIRQLEQTVAWLGHQAASGLAYAHGEGILHRDIKPANLLIDDDQQLQIADFGVARIDDSEALTRTSDVVGTLRYMAPEQLTGDSRPESDVYSLGVTLYEMASGQPAMDDASLRQALLLQKKPRGPAALSKLQPRLSIDLRTIIEKAMAPELDHRYRSAQTLADDLDRFLSGRPILARRMSSWERSRRWVRQNQTVSALATLLFVALATVAVISFVGQRRVRAALDQTETAKRSAEQTAGLAAAAMNDIFNNFASSADSISVDFHATEFSAPAVDPKTARLLQELLSYYRSLGERSTRDDPTISGRKLGIARMHVGAIHQQLGNHAAAIAAFEQAVSSLGDGEVLLRARILNQIGLAHQLLGESERAKSFHQRAATLVSEVPESAESRFELARSRILIARRLRPGMGPMSFPPGEALRQQLFLRSDRRPRGPGFGPNGPRAEDGRFTRPRPDDDRSAPPFSPAADEGPAFDPGRPNGRRRARSLNERVGPPARDRVVNELLYLALDDLERLSNEYPKSMPVKLLMTTAVREALGDGLSARIRGEDARLLEIAEQLIGDLSFLLALDDRTGENAALRFELVQLLTDFNVFREFDKDAVDLAFELLDQALPNVEYLADHHPNVPAYESLLIHTSIKAATVYCIAYDRGPGNPEVARRARALLQQAFQRQLVLKERNEGSQGYALWCALILLRTGDLQLLTEETQSAMDSYVEALRHFPAEALTPDGSRTPWELAELLLHRFGHSAPPRLIETARELARDIAERTPDDTAALRERLAAYLDELKNG